MNNEQKIERKEQKKCSPYPISYSLLPLLFVLCSLYFASCHNILEAPKTAVNEAGTGTLLLTIGENGAERTIMPKTILDDFVRFDLGFINKDDVNKNFDVTWTDSTGMVAINAGTWDLTANAYLSDGVGGLLHAATGTLKNIVITSGKTAGGEVPLFPIITAGKGTFRWNISYPTDVTEAGMEIKRLDDASAPNPEPIYFIGAGKLLTGTNHSMPLDAGQYSVFFKLKTAGEEASLTEFLHIYQNMESFFEYTFEKNHFPVSLLKPILAAWDTSKNEWNFADKGIKAGHFSYLGIEGLDVVDTDFNNIVDTWFNPLCLNYGAPNNLDGLKALVDAALIGIAGEGFIDNYDNQVLAENAISELALNKTLLAFDWEEIVKTLTVRVGVYKVIFSYDGTLLQPSYEEGLVFTELDNGEWAVSGTVDLSGDVVIPSVHEGRPVTMIARAVFSDSDYYAGGFIHCYDMTTITLPTSVTSIGDNAFYGCTGLASITMPPNGLISIGDLAFYGCTGLENIIIPNSVAEIGNEAFSSCDGLISVTIGGSVTSIGNYAFYGCTGLTNITIPNSVASIGNYAFQGCSKLESISIPSSVASIGEWAFSFCYALANVTIGGSVTSIGDNVFSGCTNLTNITIPNSVTSIGDGAFANCNGLTSVFYCGTESDWEYITINVNNELLENHIYYYSEIYKAGNYWHWAGETPEKWNNEQ